jgi:hypothetical protein
MGTGGAGGNMTAGGLTSSFVPHENKARKIMRRITFFRGAPLARIHRPGVHICLRDDDLNINAPVSI